MRRVTLSFDNGPDAEVTPVVLDTLRRHGIKATFFVIGSKLAAARPAAERAHAEGHWIGNHTWSHSIPFRDRGDAAFVRDEIDRTEAAIGALAHPGRLFRPYGGKGRRDGALSPAAVRHLQRGRFTCVLWNCVPGDFQDHEGWPDMALRQIESTADPLVVLHDVNVLAMRQLDRFLHAAKDRGHVFQQALPQNCIALREGIPTPLLDGGIVKDWPVPAGIEQI